MPFLQESEACGTSRFDLLITLSKLQTNLASMASSSRIPFNLFDAIDEPEDTDAFGLGGEGLFHKLLRKRMLARDYAEDEQMEQQLKDKTFRFVYDR